MPSDGGTVPAASTDETGSADAALGEGSRSPVPTEAELSALLASLPEGGREQVLSVLQAEAFSGPLPSPEAFERYNAVLHNAGDRILTMAEKEQDIRLEVQRGAITNDRRRIISATLLGGGLLTVAALATWLGQPVIAIPLGMAGTVSLLARTIARHFATKGTRSDSD